MKKRAQQEFTYETFDTNGNKGIDIIKKGNEKILLDLLESELDTDNSDILNASQKHPQRFTTHSLKTISQTYGRTIAAFYYFILLNEHISADGSDYYGTGGYEYWFSEGFLTANDIQETDYLKLEIYEYGMSLIIEFLSNLNNSSSKGAISDLTNHYQNIKIRIDRRDSITSEDEEWEEMYLKMENILNSHDLSINSRKTFDCIEFDNLNCGEILNREETYEKTKELYNIFTKYSIHELFLEEIKKALSKKEIRLHVCSPIPSHVNVFEFYFSDVSGHPEHNLEKFKKMYKRFLESDKNIFFIKTSSDYIVNYIKWLVANEEVSLQNNSFIYWDIFEKKQSISILNDEMEPEFIKGVK